MASGSGWNLWVWLVCLVRVVVRRYIDFLILYICSNGYYVHCVLAVATRYHELVIENMKSASSYLSVGQATITHTFPISRN